MMMLYFCCCSKYILTLVNAKEFNKVNSQNKKKITKREVNFDKLNKI